MRPAFVPITTCVEAALHEPISPELALVCPELRARAIAELVERDRAAELDRFRVVPTPREYELMRTIAEAGEEDEWVAPLPLAIVAYTAHSAARLAVEAAALVGVLLGVLSIVTVVHS